MEQASELEILTKRLESVEAQIPRLKRPVLAALLVVASILAMGQARPGRTVEADNFVLRDAAGRKRAALYLDVAGPTFDLYDADGNQRAVLAVRGNTPTLVLTQQTGSVAILASSTLELSGSEGDLYFLASGPMLGAGPSLSLFDKNEKPRALLRVNAMDTSLALYEPSGQPGATVLAAPDGSNMSILGSRPGIFLSDSEGFETQIGSTSLVTPLTGETHKTTAASFVLLGKDKKVLWSAP